MRRSLDNVAAVAGKELRGYFASPMAWVIMGLFAFLVAWFFFTYLTLFVQQSTQSQFGGPQSLSINQMLIRGFLGNTSVLILFVLPMITMRTYAEEKRSGTIELLLTSPLTDLEIILGKFIGAMGMYLALLAVTVLYVAILFVYGNPDWMPVVSGYLGLLLMGACFIAVGLFISSLTRNQMVAGTASFVVFLLLWIIDWMADGTGTLDAVLSYLSVTAHFDDFGKGVIDTKHVIYYLSFIGFGLFLTLKSVDSERWRG